MNSLPTLSRAQAHEVQRRLRAEYGINPLQTQELAGRNLARLARILLDGDLADRPIVVVAGRGSNGASGLVAARHLLNWGAWVQIVCSHAVDNSPAGDDVRETTAYHLHTLQAMGAPLAWAEEGWELPPADLVIDAIIGTGLEGAPHGKARELIQLANSSVAPILSLTLPSGIDADAGAQAWPHVQAAATLSLTLPLSGMLEPAARQACGELYLGDVGVPWALFEELGIDADAIFGRDSLLLWDVTDGVAQLVDEQ